MSNSVATGVAYQDPEFTTMFASEQIGYTASAQGAVTQATDKSTGVTLNKSAGRITMNNAALASNTAVSFTLTNSLISANDTIIVNVSGGGTAGGGGAAVGAPDNSPPAGPPPDIVGSGGIVSVGGIRVSASIAGNLQSLLSAANAAGIHLSGGGYRDSAAQVALRRAHCGSSSYSVYQAPASSCRPPTARPGASMHERGLAIDFTEGGRTLTRGSAGFQWMRANAGRFGFANLPSEPWHWSTNGN